MEPVSAMQTPSFFLASTTVLTYPMRFIGSKSESLYTFTARMITGAQSPSGYYFVPEKNLTPSEAKSYIRYAVLAHIVPSCQTNLAERVDYEIISPKDLQLDLTTLPGSLHANRDRFFDKTSGLKVMIFSNDTQIVIGFGPAASYEGEVTEISERLKVGAYVWCCGVMANLAGAIPFIYTQAEALFARIKQSPVCQDKKIVLIGHSIGGSMASYLGLKYQLNAIGFNSLALGAGLQKELGTERLSQAEQFVTHLSVSGDVPSDCPLVHYVDRCISFAGIKTPGNFGRHYRIPTSQCGQCYVHNEYLAVLIDHASMNQKGSITDLLPLLDHAPPGAALASNMHSISLRTA